MLPLVLIGNRIKAFVGWCPILILYLIVLYLKTFCNQPKHCVTGSKEAAEKLFYS